MFVDERHILSGGGMREAENQSVDNGHIVAGHRLQIVERLVADDDEVHRVRRVPRTIVPGRAMGRQTQNQKSILLAEVAL